MVRHSKRIKISKHVENAKRRNRFAGRRLSKKKKKASTKKDRRTLRYIAWRKAVYKRDGHTCQRCGKKDCYLNAHHIRPWSLFPEDRFDVNNGVTLCTKCHVKVHRCKASKFLDLGYGRGKPIPKKRTNTGV